MIIHKLKTLASYSFHSLWKSNVPWDPVIVKQDRKLFVVRINLQTNLKLVIHASFTCSALELDTWDQKLIQHSYLVLVWFSRKPNVSQKTLYLIDLENWMQCLPFNASTDNNSVTDEDSTLVLHTRLTCIENPMFPENPVFNWPRKLNAMPTLQYLISWE